MMMYALRLGTGLLLVVTLSVVGLVVVPAVTV